MFDYCASLIERDRAQRAENVKFMRKRKWWGFLPVIGRRACPFPKDYETGVDLSMVAIGAYEARAKFEARVENILNAFLDGKVQPNALDPSVPVSDSE
jgi:hypothetical protein